MIQPQFVQQEWVPVLVQFVQQEWVPVLVQFVQQEWIPVLVQVEIWVQAELQQ